MALAWALVGGRLPHAFAQQLGVGFVVVQDLVNLSPVGQAGYASVVDEIVGFDLAAEVVVLVDLLLGVVAVHGPKLHAALAAPVDGLLQLVALAHRPEDELVAILDEHAQGLGGEGPLRPDGGVAVLHNGSVKVDGDGHVLSFWLISGFPLMTCALALHGCVVLVAVVAVGVIAVGGIVAIRAV